MFGKAGKGMSKVWSGLQSYTPSGEYGGVPLCAFRIRNTRCLGGMGDDY